ncbi:hypothetical protein [Chitinimonas sp.]|uniref:hypothetical protein n=1 Tax=Chitinimonas sp. TaxID=1934313 RepID=UPI0035B15FD4
MDSDGPRPTPLAGSEVSPALASSQLAVGMNSDLQAARSAETICRSGFSRECTGDAKRVAIAAEAAPTSEAASKKRSASLSARFNRRILVLIVLIKLALLYAAHHLWFSQPLAKHMRVDLPVVENHLVGRPASPALPYPSQGVAHDPRRPAG